VARLLYCPAYVDLLEQHAFGNYRQLLEAVTLSTGMGNYLNLRGNQKEDTKTGRVPDENYAREVLQLFSIGLYQLNRRWQRDHRRQRQAAGQLHPGQHHRPGPGIHRLGLRWLTTRPTPAFSNGPWCLTRRATRHWKNVFSA
jgi:hypothetical protein